MKAEEIEITIDRDGGVRVAVHGVTGKECLNVTRPIEEALGGQVQERTFTSEYYQSGVVEPESAKERH
jgi:hypothetical protein